VAAARPDAIVNQMTALSEAHAGKPNLRKPDRLEWLDLHVAGISWSRLPLGYRTPVSE
jgi:hypothetical protein